MRLRENATIILGAIILTACGFEQSTPPIATASPTAIPQSPATTSAPLANPATSVSSITPSVTAPPINKAQARIVKKLLLDPAAVVECQDKTGPPTGVQCDDSGNIINPDLSSRNLTTLPPETENLKTLQILDLSRNKLKALPPEIGKLTNLRILYFSYNNLATLPPEIGRLSSLTYLELIQSNLKSLPAEIGQLSNLTYLNLADNELTELPPQIIQLHKVSIGLQGNPIDKLPPEICAQLKTRIVPQELCP
jgi:Leucine-rich repeat (LRR) protein